MSVLANGTLVQLPLALAGLETPLAWVQRAARAPNPVLDTIQAWVVRTLAGVGAGGG